LLSRAEDLSSLAGFVCRGSVRGECHLESAFMDEMVRPRFDRIPKAAGLMARLACARVKASGLDPGPLLQRSNLKLEQIEDIHARVSVRDQIRFLNVVADVLEDELLGFHLAQLPDLRQIGLLFYVMASSKTFIEALTRGARYASIVNEGISPKCLEGSEISVSLPYTGVSRHVDCHQIEFWMTAIVRIGRDLTGLRLVPTRVRFIHFREQIDSEFREYFGDNIEFGAAVDDICFAKRLRESAIVHADPYLNELLVRYCQEAIGASLQKHGSFRTSVENAIVPLLPHGRVHVVDIARQLAVSQRTLSRRLASDGLTFSGLLETLRRDLASRYLAEAALPISELAWLLGYKEVGSFSHAFKRWTGKTPREVRSHLAC